MAGKKKPKSTRIKKQKNTAKLDINKEKLEDTLKKQWIIKAIELMKDHYSSSYTREYIRENKDGSKSDMAIDSIMKEANAEIVSSQFSKAEEIIPIHLKRYNKNIKDALAIKEIPEDEVDGEVITWEDFYKARNRKIKAMIDALAALLQKEELLQFHNKDFVIEVNTEETIEVREKVKKLNIHKLPLDKQIQLLNLYKKMEKKDFELTDITGTMEVDQVVTEDVEAEVVELPNVHKIEQEKLPEPIKRSSITGADPTIKLRESLQKLAASRFKEAGGTLTDEEEKLTK